MKILAIHGVNNPKAQTPSLDIWRIWRPLRELKKHVDWQIDEVSSFIPNIDEVSSPDKFTEAEMTEAIKKVEGYDIVFSSYAPYLSPMLYAFTRMACDKVGAKLVLDVDDDLFSINPDNFGWWLKMDDKKTFMAQQMIRDVPYIITTNEYLANEFRKRRKDRGEKSVRVVPNYISSDYNSQPPNNIPNIIIGYFGGASHLADLHSTGLTDALRKLMHEDKRVRVHTVGMPIEEYLPKARYEYLEGKKGLAWIDEIFPSLRFDIALGPITNTVFNIGKSDIKWQESAMMGAAFVGSNIGPYARSVRSGEDGLLVENTEEDWYKALKMLVDEPVLRKRLAASAKIRVTSKYLIENNWQVMKRALEGICKDESNYSLSA